MSTELPVNPWESFEAIPGLTALPGPWSRRMGPHYPAFRKLCLDVTEETGQWFACPRCGCRHQTPPLPPHPDPDQPILAHCTCTPPHCPPFPVTLADMTVLELNRHKLALGICRAFGLEPKFAILQTPYTVQVGTWSADAVPAFLTIAVWRSHFRNAVADLVARLKSPFIHFAPTTDHFDAYPLELLVSVGAAFFPLDHVVTLTEQGTLIPNRPPGELFARFIPQPREPVSIETARQLFAIAKELDDDPALRKAPSSIVLRLYCVENLEPDQIAKRCHCSRSLAFLPPRSPGG